MFARTASGSAATGDMVSQSTMATALQGVDVASLQHTSASIDWSQVATAGGIQFAAVKATEGAYYQNPYALTDLAGAKAAGLSTMAYAFAIPNGNSTIANSASPVVQADFLLSYLGTDSTAVPLMLDIEYNPYGAECYGLSQSAMVTWISQFIAEVQKKTGRQPIIYTPGPWWTDCTGGSAAFSQLPLWEPYYSTTATSPVLPTGWANWAFWQHSGTGSVTGISGNVDLDWLNAGTVPLVDPGAQRGLIKRAVNLEVTPADPISGRSLSFSATGLPPGLSISASGQITGSPDRGRHFQYEGERVGRPRRCRLGLVFLDRSARCPYCQVRLRPVAVALPLARQQRRPHILGEGERDRLYRQQLELGGVQKRCCHIGLERQYIPGLQAAGLLHGRWHPAAAARGWRAHQSGVSPGHGQPPRLLTAAWTAGQYRSHGLMGQTGSWRRARTTRPRYLRGLRPGSVCHRVR